MAKKIKPVAPIVVIPTGIVADDVQPITAPIVADVVVPTDPAPADVPTPDGDNQPVVNPAPFDPGFPLPENVDSAIVSPTSDPEPTPAPADVPTPAPCVVVPNISAPVAYVPKLSKAGIGIASKYVASVGKVLNVGNDKNLAWGRFAQDLLKTERENSTVFGPAQFDATIAEVSALYADRFPDSEGTPRIVNHFQYAEFIDGATTLGIIGAETLAFGKVVNRLYPACFTMDKDSATSIVRDGWADWLKAIVPMATRAENPITEATISASIDAQRAALYAMNAKRFPLPKSRGSKSAKEKKAAAPPVPTPAPITSGTANAPIVPTSIIPNVNPGSPIPAPSPTPADVPTPASVPPVAPSWVEFNLDAFVKGLDVKGATVLGTAIADNASDDEVTALYSALAARLKSIRAARETAKAGAA